MSYRYGALCAQTDPELFYPDKGASARPALMLCRRCDVQQECLEDVLEYEAQAPGPPYGVCGGMTARERELMLRGRKGDRTQPPPIVARIRRLAAAGWVDREIGYEVDRTAGAVEKLRERWGIEAGQPQQHRRAAA